MFVSHREILNFVKFDQDTRYWQTHSTRYQRNIVSLFNSRWHDRDPLEQTLPIPCISSFQPFPPILFLPRFVFFFASSAILSFLLLSYPIHQVCVSLDKLYCSWPGWLVASSLSTKNEKGSKAKFVAPIVFRPPEMCSLWMIDPRKEKERNSPPIFDHRDLTFFVFWFLYVLLAVNVLNAY